MTQDTSTEAVATEFFVVTSKSGMHIGLWSDEEDAQSAMREDNGYMIGRVVCGSAYDTLAAECDTLAKQAEDCARTCAEQAEEIRTLTGQLAEARGTLDRIDVIAEVADAAPLCMGEIRELIKMNRALKSEPAPRHSVQEAARVLLNAPRSTTGPMAYAGRVAEEFLEDVECGGEITTEIIEAFLRALAQET